MGKLSKLGIKERKRMFKGFRPSNKSEASIVNAFSEVVAEHKLKKRRR